MENDTKIVILFKSLNVNLLNVVTDYLKNVGIYDYKVKNTTFHTIVEYCVDSLDVDVIDVMTDNKNFFLRENIPYISSQSYPNVKLDVLFPNVK